MDILYKEAHPECDLFNFIQTTKEDSRREENKKEDLAMDIVPFANDIQLEEEKEEAVDSSEIEKKKLGIPFNFCT